MKHAHLTGFTALFLISTVCAGAPPKSDSNLCSALEGGGRHVALLATSTGEISLDTSLDVGDLAYSSQMASEGYKIPTAYQVAISSRRIVVKNVVSNGWYVELVNPKPICKHSRLFQVNIIWNFERGETRPYPFEGELPRLTIENHATGFDDDLTGSYKFTPKIRGRMIEP